MNGTIRWGILSAANIAHKFANSNALVRGSEITAVAARTLAKAQEFAAMHSIPKHMEVTMNCCKTRKLMLYISQPSTLTMQNG